MTTDPSNVRLYIPPGTVVTHVGNRVMMEFPLEYDADEFFAFMRRLHEGTRDGGVLDFTASDKPEAPQ